MIKGKTLLTSFIYFLPPLLFLGQKFISPWAYIRESFLGYEIEILNKFAYKPMGLYAG